MSILKSTNSGRHSDLTMDYLLEHGWKPCRTVGHMKYRTEEEKLHRLMNGQFAFYLKETFVFKVRTYILLVRSIHDLDLVIKYFDVLRKNHEERAQMEAIMQSVDFVKSLGMSEYERHGRYTEMLYRMDQMEKYHIEEAEQILHDNLTLLDTKEEDIEKPENFSRII